MSQPDNEAMFPGWAYPVAAIPDRGLEEDRRADADMLETVRGALGLVACRDIRARWRIRPIGAGCYAASGRIEAEIVQESVVSTEPVEQRIEADFAVQFLPAVEDSAEEETIVDPNAAVDTEIIENGIIDIGRTVYEEIASRLDLYPRNPGEAFEWQEPETLPAERTNPFAALAALKDKAHKDKED